MKHHLEKMNREALLEIVHAVREENAVFRRRLEAVDDENTALDERYTVVEDAKKHLPDIGGTT